VPAGSRPSARLADGDRLEILAPMQEDRMLKVYDTELRSRLLLGTSRYPSPAVLVEAVKASRAQVVTVSLRRESSGERAGQGFWSIIRDLACACFPTPRVATP